jgi:putative CocE/NonD family hydrolase
MLPMRDGVRLASDIYWPAQDGRVVAGPFPTILLRTSYDKTAPRYVDGIANFFTPRGYATVLQDLRGRYASEGTGQYYHCSNVNEGRDGYDTVEWIAAQSWSNGRVAPVGASHPAIIQTAMALERPPHLASFWHDVAPINIYAHMSREGGAMALHMFGALFLHAQDAQEVRDDPAAKQAIFRAMERMRELVYETPFKPGHTPLAPVPHLEEQLFHYYYRGAYDDWWALPCNDMERYFDQHADIPGAFSGGWYDPFAVATTSYFARMTRQNASPQQLVMGPWNHQSMRGDGRTWVNDVDFGAQALWGFARFNAEQERWFDRWLKGIDNGVEREPPVRIFVMGGGDGRRNAAGRLQHGGTWRYEREWPLARARETTYYLSADGGLDPRMPAADEACRTYVFDPAHPVPTLGGAVTGFYEMVQLPELDPFWLTYLPAYVRMRSIVQDGPMNQVEQAGIVAAQAPYPRLADRPDVLVFRTSPLQEAVEVTGPLTVHLWIASTTPDTDFTAKLIDEYPPSDDYPDGYALNLVDSILRVRYRDGWDHEVLMEPGQVYPVRIPLPPTSNLFARGHRIRLDISSSNFPRFDINPNTGEPMGRHTHQVSTTNTVYCDATRPSHVVLPIIPG